MRRSKIIMNDKFIFGQYYPSNSWFHKLDPRVKLIGLFGLMIAFFLVSNLYVLLGGLLAIIILIFTSKVPIIKFFKSLRMVLFVLLFSVFFQTAFNKEGTLLKTFEFRIGLWSLFATIFLSLIFLLSMFFLKKGKLYVFILLLFLVFLVQYLAFKLNFEFRIFKDYQIAVYNEGLRVSAMVILRIVSLVFLSSLLAVTTKPDEINKALEKLFHAPVLAMMMAIAIRFIPTLIKEANKILKAQASRGVDFKEISFKSRIKQIISLLIPMFVISHKRAEELAYAMEARGYVPKEKRTSLSVIKLRVIDWIVLIVLLALLVATIVLKVLKYV